MEEKKKYADPIDMEDVMARITSAMASEEENLADVPPLFSGAVEDIEDDGAFGDVDTEPAPAPATPAPEKPLKKWASKE